MEMSRILYYKQLFLGFHSVTVVERYVLKKKAGGSGQKKLTSAKKYQFPDSLLLHTWHFYEYFLSRNCSQQTRWGDARAAWLIQICLKLALRQQPLVKGI